MSVIMKNLFADLPAAVAGEDALNLLDNGHVKISRIVSHSFDSPENFWYDQADDEWVIVLRGSAALEFAGGEIVELAEGDYLTIERHVKHRVARTSAETVWLAVHFR
jgi:cupin 2 domain-containing protein